MDITLSDGTILMVADKPSSFLQGQFLGSNRAPVSGKFAINVAEIGHGADIAFAGKLSDGRVLIIWNLSDGDAGEDLHGRVFTADGKPVGGELTVADGLVGIDDLKIALGADDKLTVTWTNVNDDGYAVGSGKTVIKFAGYQPPVLPGGDFVHLTADENFKGVIKDFNASDASGDSEGHGLTYSVVASPYGSHFTIDAVTGELTFASDPDYETYGLWGEDTVASFILRVIDSNGHFDDQRVTVDLNDLNDAPKPSVMVWDDHPGVRTAITLSEKTDVTGGYRIGIVHVAEDALGSYSLRLEGGDAGKFEIRTGPWGATELWFIGGKLDFDQQAEYRVRIVAEDPGLGVVPDSISNFTLYVAGPQAFKASHGDDWQMATRFADAFNGADGFDTASYGHVKAGVTVNLLEPGQNTGAARGDSYNSIERIRGSAFDDRITGDGSHNILNGLGGDDTLNGGGGDDTFVIDSLGDRVLDSGHGDDDRAVSWFVDINLNRAALTNIENASLRGSDDLNVAGDEWWNVLAGNDGNNRIVGHGGADTMTGGAGADTFAFKEIADSTAAYHQSDVIRDFSTGEDIIDLSAIDANGDLSGNGRFKFLAAKGASFTGHAGELRWLHMAGVGTLVQGDTDGNGTADFQVIVRADGSLTAGDFVL
jgi:Ca2+-binding RTX toxin-like protein